jgi:linoleoyl-CoA desaturase
MPRITFNNKDRRFHEAVQKQVSEYFVKNRLKPTGNRKLYAKGMILLLLAPVIYIFLLSGSYNAFVGVVLCVAFGLTLAGIAMNVMHDACHGSFAERKWINTLLGLSMNALGSNAFLWKIKHNIIHHTYTNVAEVDSDIENWPLLKQTPVQKCLGFHCYQHVYMFPLYAVTTIHWMLYFDFEKYFSRRFASTPIRYIGLKEHLVFWISKILYAVFYMALPIYFLGWQSWLIGFIIMHITMGTILTVTFQLAHLVEQIAFENGEHEKLIDTEWAVHELRTTANFAANNKLLTWYLGGLNFQIEHHLFPRVSHIHYPALSKIIQQQCTAFDLPYNTYPTLQEALGSHVRLMKKLGKDKMTMQLQ